MLFEPIKLGKKEVKNRFVRSATSECLADLEGKVTPDLLKMYKTLARGEIGTIITGYMYVNPVGRAARNQLGIHRDELIPGLQALASAIQSAGSRAIFQIHHAGGQTARMVTGSRPRAPSSYGRDPMYLSKPRPFTAEELDGLVDDFVAAARRTKEAGADGVQLHCTHGYLLAQFLSPFFNRREDDYGGTNENRYRIVGRILQGIRKELGDELILLVKMSIDDGTPGPGMTPELAADHASRMVADGVDAVEISAGAGTWATFHMSRGDAPVRDLGRAFPWIVRPMMKRKIRKIHGRAPAFEECYNAHAAAPVKQALGDVPLALVGGVRSLSAMRELVASGEVDLISLSRPLVRQPTLVERFRSSKADRAECSNCNMCIAGIFNGLPLKCYTKGLAST